MLPPCLRESGGVLGSIAAGLRPSLHHHRRSQGLPRSHSTTRNSLAFARAPARRSVVPRSAAESGCIYLCSPNEFGNRMVAPCCRNAPAARCALSRHIRRRNGALDLPRPSSLERCLSGIFGNVSPRSGSRLLLRSITSAERCLRSPASGTSPHRAQHRRTAFDRSQRPWIEQDSKPVRRFAEPPAAIGRHFLKLQSTLRTESPAPPTTNGEPKTSSPQPLCH